MATYMQFTQTTTLAALERLNNSRNGNPRWRVVWSDGRVGKTKSDAAFNYSICDSWVGKPVRIQYHVTNTGNLMVTNLESV